MAFIEWKTEYEIGITEIDDQHRHLVKMVNALYEAMKIGSGSMLLPALLDNLMDYTLSHFQAEERYMQSSRYPDFEAHQREHQELTEKVMQFRVQVRQGVMVGTAEVMDFLKSWLMDHLAGSDRDFGQYWKQRQPPT